jgi:hypothetical protein
MTAKTAGTTQGPAFAKASAIFPTQKDEAVAHYALERLTNKVLAGEYRTKSPSEELLAREIEKARKKLRKVPGGLRR